MNLVVSLIHHDVAHPVVVASEKDPKLEFANAPLPKAERVTQPLGIAVRAAWPHVVPVVAVPRGDSLASLVTHGARLCAAGTAVSRVEAVFLQI